MGGLFLFIADLVRIDTDALALAAKLPGSRMIPAAHALRVVFDRVRELIERLKRELKKDYEDKED